MRTITSKTFLKNSLLTFIVGVLPPLCASASAAPAPAKAPPAVALPAVAPAAVPVAEKAPPSHAPSPELPPAVTDAPPPVQTEKQPVAHEASPVEEKVVKSKAMVKEEAAREAAQKKEAKLEETLKNVNKKIVDKGDEIQKLKELIAKLQAQMEKSKKALQEGGVTPFSIDAEEEEDFQAPLKGTLAELEIAGGALEDLQDDAKDLEHELGELQQKNAAAHMGAEGGAAMPPSGPMPSGTKTAAEVPPGEEPVMPEGI